MKRWMAGVITIAVTFLLTFAFVYVVSMALEEGDDAVRLPLLIIAAVIGLLAAIGFVVVAFSLFCLVNPDQPLGLPEGSVRALIALLILVIFAAMTIFFFGAMRTMSLADAAAITAASDLAKQVITMLGTLLTAVASFYFGSQSATTAATKAAGTKPAGGGDGANSPGGGNESIASPRRPTPPRPDGLDQAP